MPTNRGRDDRRNQEDRIEQLKRRTGEAAGSEIIAWESNRLSLTEREQFWRRVVEIETASLTTNFQQLIDAGVELPEPDSLDDETVTAKLWEVIDGLAALRVFISESDHLSDRELYTKLWQDVLRQETEAISDEYSAWHVDLLGSGIEQDTFLYLKHYADEDFRQHWLTEFPDYQMPDHERPPYDRDARLPTPDYGHLVDDEKVPFARSKEVCPMEMKALQDGIGKVLRSLERRRARTSE